MRVTIRDITGFDLAFETMFISKRSWTPELGEEIKRICDNVLDRHGHINKEANVQDCEQFNKWLSMLLRMGRKHITVLRFIDMSIMTEGLHRAGQDDIDAHARRFDNRIIRSSTRLAEFQQGEVSDWYKDKIIPTDEALKVMGYNLPEDITFGDDTYIRTVNGYIKEKYKDNKDVKRGLYMLSIPSNFASKINLCEWAHVFKERNANGSANPEVKEWAEAVMKSITDIHPLITREVVLAIEN